MYNINLLVIISWVNLNDGAVDNMLRRTWNILICKLLFVFNWKILILFVLNSNNNQNKKISLKYSTPFCPQFQYYYIFFTFNEGCQITTSNVQENEPFSPLFHPQQRRFFFFLLMHNFPIKNIIFHHYAITIFAVWILLRPSLLSNKVNTYNFNYQFNFPPLNESTFVVVV